MKQGGCCSAASPRSRARLAACCSRGSAVVLALLVSGSAGTLFENKRDGRPVKLDSAEFLPDDIVPTVDISPLVAPGNFSRSQRMRTAIELERACSLSGFFIVKGHGVPESMREAMVEGARSFSSLPLAERLEAAPVAFNNKSTWRYRGYFPSSVNGKDGMDMANPKFEDEADAGTTPALRAPWDRWPPAAMFSEPTPWPRAAKPAAHAAADAMEVSTINPKLARWRDDARAYWFRMQDLGQALLRGLALALGEDEQFFDRRLWPHGRGMSTLRMNHYPHFTDVEALGHDGTNSHAEGLSCEDHVDNALLTLLFAFPNITGLQVSAPLTRTRHNGERPSTWVNVPVVDGGYVVNVGGGLQRILNNHFRATRHRVVYSPWERISIPFFLEAEFDASLACAPASVAPGEDCEYEPIAYGPYIHAKNKLFQEYKGRVEE